MFSILLVIIYIVSKFVSEKLGEKKLILIGMSLILFGDLSLIFVNSEILVFISFLFIVVGCAPIYPSIISSIPGFFGTKYSQVITGI